MKEVELNGSLSEEQRVEPMIKGISVNRVISIDVKKNYYINKMRGEERLEAASGMKTLNCNKD